MSLPCLDLCLSVFIRGPKPRPKPLAIPRNFCVPCASNPHVSKPGRHCPEKARGRTGSHRRKSVSRFPGDPPGKSGGRGSGFDCCFGTRQQNPPGPLPQSDVKNTTSPPEPARRTAALFTNSSELRSLGESRFRDGPDSSRDQGCSRAEASWGGDLGCTVVLRPRISFSHVVAPAIGTVTGGLRLPSSTIAGASSLGVSQH